MKHIIVSIFISSSLIACAHGVDDDTFDYTGYYGDDRKLVCIGWKDAFHRTYNPSDFTSEQVEALGLGTAKINSFLGREVQITPVQEGEQNCAPHPCDPAAEVGMGCYTFATNDIVINLSEMDICIKRLKKSWNDCFEATLMHEVGHTFGMQHVDLWGGKGVMNSTLYSSGFSWSADDKTECLKADALFSNAVITSESITSFPGHICE